MKKKERPFMGLLMRKLAPRIGAKVTVEPEWGVVGQLEFKNGRRSYFRANVIDLNPLGASEIAKDKGYAAYFLRRMGYPSVGGQTFFREDFRKEIGSARDAKAAVRYARKLRFPVIVKPNSQSQGRGVAKVSSERELRAALAAAFKLDRIALVQPFVPGDDYRIVVLDGEVISAYERIPLFVVGDGRSTITQLLRKKQREFRRSGRDTTLKLEDPRLRQNLRRARLSIRSVLGKGERLQLLDNANLSTGGESIDVTRTIHPSLKQLAIRITKDMGLRMCGVDVLVESDHKGKPKKVTIVEINAAPGLDHYARSGKAQEKLVESLYLKVLKRLGK